MICKKAEASVTLYFCLSIVLVAGLLLGLLEAVRYEGLNKDAKEWTDFAAESVCAGYQPWILAEYDLFLLDGSFGKDKFSLESGEEELEALLYENLQWTKGNGISFYRMGIRDVSITEYTLLTDDNGKVFMKYIAETMKKQLGKRAAEEILQQILDIESAKDSDINIEGSMDTATQKLLEIKQAQQSESEKGNDGGTNPMRMDIFRNGVKGSATVSNPLEDVKPLREQGIWTLAVPSGKTISNKAISVENSLLNRKTREGTDWQTVSVDWYDRILMQEYFKPLGGNFTAPDTDGALAYGSEYLIWGEDSDEKNLKKTVNGLLLVREAANYLYLQTDSVKQAEALALATALAGASVNPAVIEVVKQGLLAAWAYAESVLDVKALLSGGKIPVKKTSANWQTSLSGLAGAGGQSYSGETTGLTYENYLDAFLYAQTDKTIAYRMMDLMEQKLCQQPGYANSRMDNMITALQIKADYATDTVFTGIFAEDTIGGYAFVKKAEYVYQ